MATDLGKSRVLFDISTSCRWSGPAVGIIRVERELAGFARANIKSAVFVVYDARSKSYRVLKKCWVAPLLSGNCAIDHHGEPDPTGYKRRWRDTLPDAVQPFAKWIGQFRRQTLLALEARRLKAPHGANGMLFASLQTPLMSRKYRLLMLKTDGTRRPFVNTGEVLGPTVTPQPGDTLVLVGAGWGNTNVAAIAAMKSAGARFVTLCHDIIPLMFPHYYKAHDVEAFRRYTLAAFPLADLIVFSTDTIRRDATRFAADHGLAVRNTAIVPFGCDVSTGPPAGAQIAHYGLTAQKYWMLVSTIEPRKGHRLMLSLWRRLKAEGILDRYDFKMVFVGRPGWLTDTLIADIEHEQKLSDRIVLLTNAEDDTLKALYAGVAFCVYPSEYEGYGLPLVEAFLNGKPVIASTGGSIPEVVNGLSPCIDTKDTQQWYATLCAWIADPSARKPYADKIAKDFRPLSWEEAGRAFFNTISNAPDDDPPPG